MKKVTNGVAAFACLISAASAVQAQTSVRLGGQVKLGADHVSVGSKHNTDRSATRLSNNTSFWYIDAREDLGANRSAYVRVEQDFSADTGAIGAGRNTFIGLSDPKLGKLQLGRQSVYFSHHWSVADAHGSFDAAPNAANSLNVLGTINGTHFAGGFLNNTIRYEAPNFAGFSGTAAYSFDAESVDRKRNKTLYINPTYTHGKFKVGVYHMTRKSQGNLLAQTVGSLDQSANRLAFGYADGGIRVGLIIDSNKVHDLANGTSQHRLAYAIPASYAFGPHQVSATWGQARPMSINGVKQPNTGMSMLSVSYQYALSKRTQMDVSVVQLRNQRNGRYNFWLGGVGGGMQLPVADAGAAPRMVYAGIKHMF